jgi:hypothetical protein
VRIGCTQPSRSLAPELPPVVEGPDHALRSLHCDLVALIRRPRPVLLPSRFQVAHSRRGTSGGARRELRHPSARPTACQRPSAHPFCDPARCLAGFAIERSRRFARAGTRQRSRLETESPLGAGPLLSRSPRRRGPSEKADRHLEELPGPRFLANEPQNRTTTTQETRTWETRTERT